MVSQTGLIINNAFIYAGDHLGAAPESTTTERRCLADHQDVALTAGAAPHQTSGPQVIHNYEMLEK